MAPPPPPPPPGPHFYGEPPPQPPPPGPQFPYRDLIGSQIRVIRIESNKDDWIHCHMSHVALDEAPHYHALSYVWGNPKIKRAITVNGYNFLVTENLYSALRRLRSIPRKDPNSFNFFWADAICVNQADTKEKNKQVPRMGTIYEEADLVFIWVSPVSDRDRSDISKTTMHKAIEPKRANQAARQVLTLYRRLRANLHGRTDSQWLINEERDRSELQHYIGELGLQHPWFRRIWTVQEAVLATKSPVFLFHGDTSVPGMSEAITLDSLASYEDSNTEGVDVTLEVLNGLKSMRTWVKDPGTAADSFTGNAGWMLLKILGFIQFKDATVFHDHLYGIYGIMEILKSRFPQLHGLPEVDYDLPAAHIFTKFTKFIIETTGNTAILDSVLTRSRVPGAPTWVCGFYDVWNPKYSPPLDDDESEKPVFSANDLRLSITGYIAAPIWIVIPEASRRVPTTLEDRLQQIEDRIVKPVATRFNLERKVVRWRLCTGNNNVLASYESFRLGRTDSPIPAVICILGSCVFATDRGYTGYCHIGVAAEVNDRLCYRKGAENPIIVRQVSGHGTRSGTYQVIGPPVWFGEDTFLISWDRVDLV